MSACSCSDHPDSIEASVQRVMAIVASYRLPLVHEKETQAELARALTAAGIEHEREVILSPSDRPDFLLPSGLAIEVKLRSSGKRDVFRQLQRYAEHDRVSGLLLVSNLSMGLPAEIGGKPAWFVSLGRSWL